MPFLPWVDFHARWRFARSTIPEEKSGTTRSLKFNRVLNIRNKKEDEKKVIDDKLNCIKPTL